ncbi:MAG: polyamine aminopropyltransferase [Armatimonadetes bacterium]|nr:polyamine aminopropyltransferase [Armatimonadota bacterium]MDW8122060.1 polyamine aminopropyltransferase [Armatimonadota bacterium]
MKDLPEDLFVEEQRQGVFFGLQVHRWLEKHPTAYQDLIVAETTLGRLLALDGKVMVTEADEAFYHEMLVHPPLMTHPAPKRVLVIGGGDGGTVREVLKHPTVQQVTWVEIDQQVLSACRKWLPRVSAACWQDPRVSLIVSPGEKWLRGLSELQDIIIVDGSDPVGPSQALFEQPFFANCSQVLSPNGILALQCGSPFYYKEEVQMVWNRLNRLFPFVRLYLGFVPTYPSGLWTYAMASTTDLQVAPAELRDRFRGRGLGQCRYYSPDIHIASQILPPFVEELLAAESAG